MQKDFANFVKNYLQVTFERSMNGWSDAWQKYREEYISWLKRN